MDYFCNEYFSFKIIFREYSPRYVNVSPEKITATWVVQSLTT